MNLFEFNCFSLRTLITLFFLLIVNFLNHIILYKNQRNFYFEKNYPLFTLLKYLSLLFAFILYYYEKKNFNIENINQVKKKLRKNSLFNYYSQKNYLFSIQNLIFFIIISIIDLMDGNFFYAQLKKGGQLSQITSFILFVLLFQQKIYKHQSIAILICFISFILPIKILIENYSHKKMYLMNSIILFNLFGFIIVFQKYLIEIRYFDRFLLLFYKGIFGIILTIISQLIYYYFNINYMLIELNLIFEYKLTFLIYFILIFLEETMFIILINETKNIISLFIFIFLKYIPTIFFPLKYKNNVVYKSNTLLTLICDLINIFFSLIFMEIIILKFCNYNKNVNNEISKRAEKEAIEVLEFANISKDKKNISDLLKV